MTWKPTFLPFAKRRKPGGFKRKHTKRCTSGPSRLLLANAPTVNVNRMKAVASCSSTIFLPKIEAAFLHLVFSLDNLIPCCQACNSVKGQHVNKGGKEIINPFQDSPLCNHLRLDIEDMGLRGTSDLGRTTVDKLNKALNADQFVGKVENRDGTFSEKILRGAIKSRRNTKVFIDKWMKRAGRVEETAHIVEHLQDLLELIQPNKPLTATYAGLILEHPVFLQLLERVHCKDPEAAGRLTRVAEMKAKYLLTQSSPFLCSEPADPA